MHEEDRVHLELKNICDAEPHAMQLHLQLRHEAMEFTTRIFREKLDFKEIKLDKNKFEIPGKICNVI